MIKKLISIFFAFIIMFSAIIYFIPTSFNMGIQANADDLETSNEVSVTYDATAKTVTITGNAACIQVTIKITKSGVTMPVYLGYMNVVDGKYSSVVKVSSYSEGYYMVSLENEDSVNMFNTSFTITNDASDPVITISPYTTSPTNKDINVTATTNKGSLNAASHTFTENGSFEFIATDAAGNVTKQTVTIANIDKTAPVVSGVVNNAFYNTDKSIAFNEGTGTLNGTSFTSGSSAAKEGLNTLTVTDAAGNSTTVLFTIDKTKPVVTAKDTANKTVANNGTVYGDVVVSYSDVNMNTITVKKGTAAIAYPSNGKFTADGTYTITATDKAGNAASITFTINKSKPVITAKTSSGSIANNAYVNKNVTVTVSGSNVTKTVTKDGKSYIYPSNGIFTASGKYVITAKSSTNVSTFIFTIDTVKPAISSQSVTNNGFTKSNVTIIIKDTNLSTKTVTKNGTKITYPSNGIFTAEGKYIITVKDKAGNTVTFTFTIDKTAPKITVKNSSGTAIANNGSAGRSASITVTETNISAKTITKNGTKISWPNTNSVTSVGSYTVTVTDKAGNKSTFTFRVQ